MEVDYLVLYLNITGSFIAAAKVIWSYRVGIISVTELIHQKGYLKASTPIPCPVDRDDIVSLTMTK